LNPGDEDRGGRDSQDASPPKSTPMTANRSLLARPTTYARARLQLGMGGVGLFVVLSAVALAAGLPARLFGGMGHGLFDHTSLLALWLAGVAVLCLPLDYLGGYALPKRFGRRHPELDAWLIGWLRGVLVLLVVMSVAGGLVILGGRYGGRVGATGMVGVLVAGWMAGQMALAQLVGGLRRVDGRMDAVDDELRKLGVVAPPVVVVDSDDEGFTGGIAGLPTAERLVLPLAWIGRFEPEQVALLLARRTLIVDHGMRALGLAGALLWTLVMFAIAASLPGAGVQDVAGFVTTSLWFTLLSFVGLMVLPTPSRNATFSADALLVSEHDAARGAMPEVLAGLDAFQDDEPSREPGVERIFHPIPNLESRRAAIGSAREKRIAPWHLARAAISMSIVALNPLARLVHCNAGRPDLWVFLPADG